MKIEFWGYLKPGSFESIRHIFEDGIPLESPVPKIISEDGRPMLRVDLARLTPEQFIVLCGPELSDFEAEVIAREGIGMFAEDFYES